MKKISILFFAVALMAFAACQKEGEAEIECFIGEQNIPYTGGSVSVRISSNAPWTASWSDSLEVNVEPSSGRGDAIVTVSAKPNVEGRTRATRVKFLAVRTEDDQRSTYFVVTRDAKPMLICEQKSLSTSAEGGSVYFTVNSNCPWKVKSVTCNGEEWDWTGKITPDCNDKNNVDVEVKIPRNEESASKVYLITLALDDYPDTELVLTVNQAGA